MNAEQIIAIVLGTSLIALFAKLYSTYKVSQKKLIDLEYKNEKHEIKDKVKDDSIDTIIARITKRFK